jgi:hypothetical protein
VSRLIFAYQTWQSHFYEDFWCCEGFVALSREKVFMIMDLSFGAVDFEADGAARAGGDAAAMVSLRAVVPLRC